MAKKVGKCPDCRGTGIDHVRSNPFLKKECPTCMGTGSAYPPEYIYVCDVCEASRSRLLGDSGEDELEMACHKCEIVICPRCQVNVDGRKACPKCGGELFPAII